MYDDRTRELISRVVGGAEVGGPDVADLLTEAYATLATLRLRMEDPANEEDPHLHQLAGELRRLAIVLSVQACLLPENEERRAAAFVAATAHRFLFLYSTLTGRTTGARLILDSRHVSSDLCAALLFLSAGYPADAAAAVAESPGGQQDVLRQPLLDSLIDLARGRPQFMLGRDLILSNGSAELVAEMVLWRRLMRSIGDIARLLLGFVGASWADVRQQLESVLEDAAIELDDVFSMSGTRIVSTFAGPHHLATILLAATRGLENGALTGVPVPTGPDPSAWQGFVSRRAATRPFLWTNHLGALRAGLLNNETSAVISFPTGAGKSTMAELKIAANFIQGRQVVYLVPTLALASQIGENIRHLASECRVDGDELQVIQDVYGDGIYADLTSDGETAALVTTPERCLLLLGLFPERFQNLGLFVFDEIHMVHMEEETEGRRCIDAMLCLLKLLEVAPEADVLFMSAMVKNGHEIAA